MKYKAFISYNHKDKKEARKLQKRLEAYSLPTIIKDEKGNILQSYSPNTKFKVFRDATDLVTTVLDEGLKRELDQSEYLIVVCSPNSAKSLFVGEEVSHFINTGKRDKIIAYIIKGTPYSNGIDECFNPIIKKEFPNGSLLGLNKKDSDEILFLKNREIVAKIVSLLIGLPKAFSFIWNRYKLRYIKVLLFRLFLFILTLLSIFAAVSWTKQKEKPFDMQIRLAEAEKNPNLPEIANIIVTAKINEDIPIHDTLSNLSKTAIFKNIPGRMIDKPVKISINQIDCLPVDTILNIQPSINISLHRDSLRYGKIKNLTILVKSTPLCNETIEIDNATYQTSDEGKLDCYIPFNNQKESYEIIYKNLKGVIKMPCVGTPCVNLK